MRAPRAVGLLIGALADSALGDPRRAHPVSWFGAAAQRLERRTYRDQRVAGAGHTALLVGGAVTTAAVVQRAVRRRPVTEAAVTAATTWAVLGGSSLADEGAAMSRLLVAGDLPAARHRLNNLCGRNAAQLTTPEVARATVESLAENTSDAVIAPLVWGALGGLPGLVGYRAVNTLDAMIGHRSPRYRNFGWAAARLDDAANLLPARFGAGITAACAPGVAGSAAESWRVRTRDAAAHPSPNAGQLEAGFAGALRVQLGGRTVYEYAADSGASTAAEAHQQTEQRPELGDGRAVTVADVARAVRLSRFVGATTAVLAAGAALLPRARTVVRCRS